MRIRRIPEATASRVTPAKPGAEAARHRRRGRGGQPCAATDRALEALGRSPTEGRSKGCTCGGMHVHRHPLRRPPQDCSFAVLASDPLLSDRGSDLPPPAPFASAGTARYNSLQSKNTYMT